MYLVTITKYIIPTIGLSTNSKKLFTLPLKPNAVTVNIPIANVTKRLSLIHI